MKKPGKTLGPDPEEYDDSVPPEFDIQYADLDEGYVVTSSGDRLEVVTFEDEDGEEAESLTDIRLIVVRIPEGGYVALDVYFTQPTYH